MNFWVGLIGAVFNLYLYSIQPHFIFLNGKLWFMAALSYEHYRCENSSARTGNRISTV